MGIPWLEKSLIQRPTRANGVAATQAGKLDGLFPCIERA
jgi:hypothetical protein